MNKQTELSFDEFKNRCNNFMLHFVITENDFGGYRTSQHFLEFQKHNPDLEAKLSEEFTQAWLKERDKIPNGFEIVMGRFFPRLYEAYKLMRGYVDREVILFQ